MQGAHPQETGRSICLEPLASPSLRTQGSAEKAGLARGPQPKAPAPLPSPLSPLPPPSASPLAPPHRFPVAEGLEPAPPLPAPLQEPAAREGPAQKAHPVARGLNSPRRPGGHQGVHTLEAVASRVREEAAVTAMASRSRPGHRPGSLPPVRGLAPHPRCRGEGELSPSTGGRGCSPCQGPAGTGRSHLQRTARGEMPSASGRPPAEPGSQGLPGTQVQGPQLGGRGGRTM